MCHGFRHSPHNKIASAPDMSTRFISARSRVNSIAETKNNARKGIRFTRVIVVINSVSNRSQSNPRRVLLLPAATEVSVNENQTYKFVQLSLSQSSSAVKSLVSLVNTSR